MKTFNIHNILQINLQQHNSGQCTLWCLQINSARELVCVWFQAVFCKYSCLVCVRRREDVCGGGRVAAGGEGKHRGGPELPQ